MRGHSMWSALRAEIQSVIEAAEVKYAVAVRTLGIDKGADRASRDDDAMAGTLVLSDYIIYREAASELGRLTPGLIKEIVEFYASLRHVAYLADNGNLAHSMNIAMDFCPRIHLTGNLIIAQLDQYEKAQFSENCKFAILPEELKAMAEAANYPITKLGQEFGEKLEGKSAG
jgi:hypothetical protein